MALEAEKYTDVVHQRSFRVVQYGVNKIFRPNVSMARPVPYPYVLSVSGVVPHKNFEDSIKVFASLRQRYKVPHVLYIIGAGPEKYVQSLKNLAIKLHIGNSINFMGSVPNQSLPGWYAYASAFMLTSGCESFGLPVIEAMASGTPVIVSNKSGLPDTVSNAGIIEDPFNTDIFADKLYQLLYDKKLREKFIKLGIKRASEFCWEKAAKDTMEIIINCV